MILKSTFNKRNKYLKLNFTPSVTKENNRISQRLKGIRKSLSRLSLLFQTGLGIFEQLF